MPHVSTPAELVRLARDLHVMKDELAAASTSVELDMLIEKYAQAKLFARLRPQAREVLFGIIARKLAEVAPREEGAGGPFPQERRYHP